MQTVNIHDLCSLGFSSIRCPITQLLMPNMTKDFDGFCISYSHYLSAHDSDTTALVLQGRVFFILNGNHTDAMVKAAHESGIDGCVAVFVDRLAYANPLSEHRMAIRLDSDRFSLYQTTVDVIGRQAIERLRDACASTVTRGKNDSE